MLARIDAFQRRHARVAFVYAVLKRYGEDRGAWLAAAISYYGFLALLPCLVAFVTIVYLAFEQTPTLLEQILDALWTGLPFLGGEVEGRVKPIEGEPAVVLAALVVTIWGAVGVIRVMQDALNQMWGVPRYRQPSFVAKVVRGLAVLGIWASGIATAAVVAALVVDDRLPLAGVVGTTLLGVALNLGLVLALFWLLTARSLKLGDLLAGAVVAALAMSGLTLLGGIYVDRVVARASALYGSFAAVIGLFAWISLVVQVIVIGNLVNVVRREQLWPRALAGPHLWEGDVRANEFTIRREEMISHERLAASGYDRDAGQETSSATRPAP